MFLSAGSGVSAAAESQTDGHYRDSPDWQAAEQVSSPDRLPRQSCITGQGIVTIQEQRFQHGLAFLSGPLTTISPLTVFSAVFFLIIFFYYTYDKRMHRIIALQTLR